MSRVLLIEDDAAVRQGLELALGRQGHRVDAVESGESGLDRLRTEPPDVVVLDLMLPGIDGFEVCRRIQATSEVPIIMLTARGDDMDVVAGLEAGADDYVVKPVQARVLEARIRAVLRRTGREQAAPEERYGDLTIDRSGLVVTRQGARVGLTPTELRLLLELSATPGRVYSRQQLLESVWDQGYLGDSRLVDACVQRLRAKIEDDSAAPVYVQTVRGFGYRFGPL
ncbi:response regulator transcription factor [Prauserella flavalba]|uniref:response regulator transcription factor n=1 Tax=Prauserella flavalba TaxID=1477506 RepID=UPI000D75CCB4|nr:response regulator transcription factor [Prauserella flavalba]